MGEKTFTVTATTEFKLTEEDIEDIVITALNGGIGYWACLDNTQPEFADQGDECTDAWTAKILLNGGKVSLIDEEDDETVYTLTLEKLLNGIKKFVEDGMDAYGAFCPNHVDLCNIDTDVADSIVQLGIFDELVFG